MFYFLGIGSAFNPKEGNTSAFLIENNNMLLIDCGETVFGSILENDLLNNINDINVFITHLHPDHVGSLASLIFYCYFRKQILLNIVIDDNVKYLENFKEILNIFGVSKEMYKFKNTKELYSEFESFDSVKFVPTNHYEGMDCYGIEFLTKNGIIYYSGDSDNIDYIKKTIESGREIDKIFTESTFAIDYPGSPHTSLMMLDKDIPENLRNKIYCMHFDDKSVIEMARKLKFTVPEKYSKN